MFSKTPAHVDGADICVLLDRLVLADHHGHHGHRDPGCGREHLCGHGKHPEAFQSFFLWRTENSAANRFRKPYLFMKGTRGR